MIGRWHENPEDRLEVLKLFLDNGQDVNAIGQDGMSILHYCAEYGWVEGVEYLLSHELKSNLTIGDIGESNKMFRATNTVVFVDTLFF